MKKMVKVLAMVILMIWGLLCGPNVIQAMGPTFSGPHTLAWTANAATDNVTGYYVYWRTGGSTAWSDTNRRSVAPSAAPTFDLLTLNLGAGTYDLCVTAYRTGTAAAESGPSNIVPFVYTVPASPGGAVLR